MLWCRIDYDFVLTGGRWVQTDSGDAVAKKSGMEQAPTTVQESVDFILGKVCHLQDQRKLGLTLGCRSMHRPKIEYRARSSTRAKMKNMHGEGERFMTKC